ncbi:MAG: hypothetical protein JST59_00870 [Actinobacteria bacterium]|nr:hypothetical protein [Actinomycetota bacterium]
MSEIIGLQELVCLPHNKLRGTLNECNCLLLMLAERGQADDSHPKFLRFFKFTLQLNDASGRSLQSFAGLLRSSRRIQNFKLASRDEEFKLEDQLIFEIYIILAGKSLVGTLPLSSIVAIFKDTSRELKLRKLCVQYLQVEYLQKTYKQPDHVIFESVEEEQGSVIDRQLANYVTSLKEYCMGEVRVVDSTVGDGQIVAVIFLLYMLCLGRL